ncbi:MAG: sulfite exporter TauE/SafE family protein [Deltaproteobacteria bacterium]|nr:sulfite exporter TauE/SafE family protein [Deltaproteobacteria bacterium]
MNDLFTSYLGLGIVLAHLGAFGGGVLASLTPCIYPVIPITVAYIGGRSSGHPSRWRGFFLSLYYVAGMAVIYLLLGIFAALSGRLFGQISSHWLVNLVVGNIVLLCALSMLGVYEFKLPGPKGHLGHQRRGSALGAFLVGMTSGFIVAPCAAPILGAILGIIALRQQVVYGITLMIAFALGLGTLLILIGTFSGLAASLPKSGRWMIVVERIFGVILLLFAEYLLLRAGMFWP